MKNLAYKKFSFKRHMGNIGQGRPSLCQFEVTYRCGLRCAHCLTSCYNHPAYRKAELSTQKIGVLFNRLQKAGVLWLCLTGGDPMARPDFGAIYNAAKDRGFLITVFTSAFHLAPRILELLRRRPPFSIEVTMNAAKVSVYDKIVGVQGAFDRVKKNLAALEAAKLPVKIKMQLTRQTMAELPAVRRFAHDRGWAFEASSQLYPRLNGDPAPCALRVPASLIKPRRPFARKEGCGVLFGCAATGGDGFYIDPSGNLFLCPLVRPERVSLLKRDVSSAVKTARRAFASLRFSRDAACASCAHLHDDCAWCPGQAFLEAGDPQARLPYYCLSVGKKDKNE